jgi:tRNA (guanine37-N1)-methyltransferase
MRIDVVSIFPDFLAPLELSLAGKAREAGLLDIRVHDLRQWTHDRHHTVDDAPAGGGAGMVMKPEPWGEAFDALEIDGAIEPAVVVVPTPSGRPFTQAIAAELAQRPWLVFACGRYEGIDQRVIDHTTQRVEVWELSLGDYVLNGGEVAALAMIEAIARLVPGFMGNPESLTEESHREGLLEYPVYTRPRSWRGLEIPEVLTSGDHGAIARWRQDQAERRTAERRPDLLHGSRVSGEGELRLARPADAGELLTLQRACWVREQQANPEVFIPPLHESLADVEAWMREWVVLVLRRANRLVAAARGRAHGSTWDIGRLMVAPDLQGQGLGRQLLSAIEGAAPPEVTTYELFTGVGSAENIRMYKQAGYRLAAWDADGAVPGAVRLTKSRPPS